MNKRKDSTTGVTTDDPTDKSDTESRALFFYPSKYDLIPIVLALVVITLGLTAGLTSFFLLRDNEIIASRDALQSSVAEVETGLNAAFTEVISVVMRTASLFQTSKTWPLGAYDQFAPYVMSSGKFPKFLTTMTYILSVPISEEDAFVQRWRSSGDKNYVNLTITGRDSNNKVIPPIWTPIRCVVMQIVPVANMLNPNSLGYDLCTDAAKNETFNFAMNTGKPIASGRIVSSLTSANVVSITIQKSILNTTTNKPLGVISGVVIVSDLLAQSLTSIIDRYDVAVYDTNATGDTFIYNSATSADSIVTSAMTTRMIANAAFTARTNISVTNRVFHLVLIPQEDYAARYQTSTKFVALIVSLVIMSVLLVGCVVLYFTRKLLLAKKSRAAAGIQIDLLKTNQSALRTLLDRIACQESKTRAVINSLPDIIFVISDAGKILQTNTAFDEAFPFNQQEMVKGVYSWDIFTELASDFFRVCDENSDIETLAQRRFGDVIEVRVRVRDIRGSHGESSSSQSDKHRPVTVDSRQFSDKQISGALNMHDESEAYVIIAKNLSMKETLEVNVLEQVQRHEFEREFRNKTFYNELKKYCEKNQNVENILFLEQVREYKKSQFGVRVDMKMAIFDRFIKPDAPMQLNLANEAVLEESIKINKSMGDVDVFKSVEEIVLKTLALDIYPRYLMDKRKASVGDISV
jgi:PAS domain S-box-containing protein